MGQTADILPHEKHHFLPEYGHFIGGEWVDGASGKKISLGNPATGEHLCRIQAGNAVDAKRAVDAAARAFPDWSQTHPQQRQELLQEFARRLKARLNHYAMLETLNNGKTVSEASWWDIPQTIEQFNIFAGLAWNIGGTTIDRPGTLAIVHREPVGVCAQIIPWNVPLIMMSMKVAPALATGNTVVLKPSEIVCLSVLEFFLEMADIIPPGVVNVLTGYGPDVGEALVTDSRVRKVALTGSRPTARTLIEYASVNVIPQCMELGGKSAVIICEDADIEAAAEGATISTVFNKGEVCVAGSRVFVHDRVRDTFLDRFTSMLGSVRIGDPTRFETQLGAQASQMQFDKILGYIDCGVKEGATIHTGGSRACGGILDRGYFIQPTIFTDVNNQMTIAREEIFGPVTAVMGWNDENDVLRQVNDSDYGLASGIWTQNIGRAHRMARSIQAGLVWVNRYYNPVGGISGGPYKQSGFGREFGYEAALENYTRTKAEIVNLIEGPIGLFK